MSHHPAPTRRRTRRRLSLASLVVGVVVTAAVVTSVADVQASGTTPAALAPGDVLFDSDRGGNFELYALHGGEVRPLTEGAQHDSFWPRASPDGAEVVFHRTPRGVRDRDYSQAATWLLDVASGTVRPLLARGAHGWGLQAHAEWSPDGSRLALIGGPASNPQVFIVDRQGAIRARVTGNGTGGARPGTGIDPSWSPDGRSLLFVGCPSPICLPTFHEIYRVGVDGTDEVRLTNDLTPDYDPYFAPDGSAIAWLRNTSGPRWGIWLMRPDGSAARPVIDDGAVNSKPDWADSATIYFHRAPGLGAGSPRFNIYRVRRGGSTPERILPDHLGVYDNEYPDVVEPGAAASPAVATSTSEMATSSPSATTTSPPSSPPSSPGLGTPAPSSQATLPTAPSTNGTSPQAAVVRRPAGPKESRHTGLVVLAALSLVAVATTTWARWLRRRSGR